MKTAVAYIRVSTDKQGKSGLGLEAQMAAINAFVASNHIELIDTFIEVETGKGSDALRTRPQLACAIEVARLTGAVVLAAKLDRITRNVHFGSGLFARTDVAFRITDMPHADNFQLNIMLAVAQLEAEMISKRTKLALAAAKARGIKLGGANGSTTQKDRAVAFADGLKAIVAPMVGMTSRAIAAALNAQGVTTPAGGAWSHKTVLRLLDRLQLSGAAA